LALKVDYRFKQLPKRGKEAIISAGKLRLDRISAAPRAITAQLTTAKPAQSCRIRQNQVDPKRRAA